MQETQTILRRRNVGGRPKETYQKLDNPAIFLPAQLGRSFIECYGRSMRKAEGILYLQSKFEITNAVPNWSREAAFCGVSRMTMLVWRKEFLESVRPDMMEVRFELFISLQRALDECGRALHWQSDPSAETLTLAEARLRLKAARTIGVLALQYTEFLEKWGFKNRFD
ncbi:MAG: hypothetical protein RIQ56_380 [Candidatus Parcubacteria bacterium]|jgi:hypothetical protein